MSDQNKATIQRYTGISIVRIANGKIAEEWTSRDDLSIMQQLGIAP